MKKIIPAIAFMFVVVASFAFRPAEASKKQTNFDPQYFEYSGGTSWEPTTDEVIESCTGAGHICAIVVTNPTTQNVADAKAAAETLDTQNPQSDGNLPNSLGQYFVRN